MKKKCRSKRQYLYGSLGFLSILGILGIVTDQRTFLAFFAFLVDFEFFFLPSDEMMEQYMEKSASMAFYSGMIGTALVTLFRFFGAGAGDGAASEALLWGMSAGWSIAVIVHGLANAYYLVREGWGLSHD